MYLATIKSNDGLCLVELRSDKELDEFIKITRGKDYQIIKIENILSMTLDEFRAL